MLPYKNGLKIWLQYLYSQHDKEFCYLKVDHLMKDSCTSGNIDTNSRIPAFEFRLHIYKAQLVCDTCKQLNNKMPASYSVMPRLMLNCILLSEEYGKSSHFGGLCKAEDKKHKITPFYNYMLHS